MSSGDTRSLHPLRDGGPLHAVARACRAWQGVELGEVIGSERQVRGRGVLVEALGAACAWDRDHAFVLREEPGQGDLARRRLVALGHLAHAVDDREVLLHRLGGEARVRGAHVAFGDRLARDLARAFRQMVADLNASQAEVEQARQTAEAANQTKSFWLPNPPTLER